MYLSFPFSVYQETSTEKEIIHTGLSGNSGKFLQGGRSGFIGIHKDCKFFSAP